MNAKSIREIDASVLEWNQMDVERNGLVWYHRVQVVRNAETGYTGAG